MLVVAAVVAWVVGIWGADPRTMDQTGLLALFEPPMIAGLALLTVGFVLADQIRTLHRASRLKEHIETAPDALVAEVRGRLRALLGLAEETQ